MKAGNYESIRGGGRSNCILANNPRSGYGNSFALLAALYVRKQHTNPT